MKRTLNCLLALSSFLLTHYSFGNETFEEFSLRAGALVQPICECVLERLISEGATPGDPLTLTPTVEIMQQCAPDAGSTDKNTNGSLMQSTQAASTGSVLPNVATWTDERRKEFVDGCTQGILVPAYRDYTIRAKVVDSLVAARTAQAAVAQSYSTTGELPANLGAAGLQTTALGKPEFVDSIQIAEGALVVRYSDMAAAEIAGKSVVLTPYVTNDKKLIWACGRAAKPAEAMQITAADGRSEHLTTLEDKYLPPSCRNGE